MPHTDEYEFVVVGYQPHESVLDPDDYGDFRIGRVLNVTDMQMGLDAGIFPPGLMIKPEGGRVGKVTGLYGRQQYVEVV